MNAAAEFKAWLWTCATAGGLALCLGSMPALACDPSSLGPDAETLTGQGITLAYRPDPGPIAAGTPFSMDVVACAGTPQASIERLEADAQMPEHKHGMNYTLKITPRGSGHYRIDGYFLHMSGRWELTFSVKTSTSNVQLSTDIMLP